MPLAPICRCDHPEYMHNYDDSLTKPVGESCFSCSCPRFIADNLKMLERAIGPTVYKDAK